MQREHHLLVVALVFASAGVAADPTLSLDGGFSKQKGYESTARLMSLASGSAATLSSDTTYGGERTTVSRSGSGAWNVGAYVYGASTSSAPTPPTNVKVLVVQ